MNHFKLGDFVTWDTRNHPDELNKMIGSYGVGPFMIVGLRMHDGLKPPYPVKVSIQLKHDRREFSGHWFEKFTFKFRLMNKGILLACFESPYPMSSDSIQIRLQEFDFTFNVVKRKLTYLDDRETDVSFETKTCAGQWERVIELKNY